MPGLKVTVRGSKGRNTERKVRDILSRTKVKAHKIGWPGSATYPDGQTVSEVALWNEFGVPGRIPERPFFRNGNKAFAEGVSKMIIRHAEDGMITRRGAEKIALEHENSVRKSIVKLKEPPNAPSTVSRKGSANPLVDTGLMMREVTHDIVE